MDKHCPKCSGEMRPKKLTFNILHRCPKCGTELMEDKRTGKVRKANWFGWGGD